MEGVRYRVLSILTAALTLGAALSFGASLPSSAKHGVASVGPLPDPGFVGDTTTPLRFLLEDYYRIGQTVEVEIQNVGSTTYVFNPYYEACEMAYRDGSGRAFKIPPGTHCDLITEGFIAPGETVRLFTWNLDECVIDRWGCALAQPLPPGAYTIRGEFLSIDGDSAVAQKTIVIVGDPNPALLAVALGAFGAIVLAGLAALAVAARGRRSPRSSVHPRD